MSFRPALRGIVLWWSRLLAGWCASVVAVASSPVGSGRPVLRSVPFLLACSGLALGPGSAFSCGHGERSRS